MGCGSLDATTLLLSGAVRERRLTGSMPCAPKGVLGDDHEGSHQRRVCSIRICGEGEFRSWTGHDSVERADEWLRRLCSRPRLDGRRCWDLQFEVRLEDGCLIDTDVQVRIPQSGEVPGARHAVAHALQQQALDLRLRSELRRLSERQHRCILGRRAESAPLDFLGTTGKEGWLCTCGRLVPTVHARPVQGTGVVEVPAMHAPLNGSGVSGACLFTMISYSGLAPVLPWLPQDAPRRAGLDDLERLDWMALILANVPREHGGPLNASGGGP